MVTVASVLLKMVACATDETDIPVSSTLGYGVSRLSLLIIFS